MTYQTQCHINAVYIVVILYDLGNGDQKHDSVYVQYKCRLFLFSEYLDLQLADSVVAEAIVREC